MQAIILAAGKGTRMRPLTHHFPKPLARFTDVDGVRKSLVEHNLELLPNHVNELIFVVGYMKDAVKNYFGDEFNGRSVKYVEQEQPLGTAHALSLVKPLIRDRFLVMMGDDLYCKTDIDAIVNDFGNAILVKKIRGKFSGGNVKLDQYGNLNDIVEGVHDGGYVNAALYSITPEYFQYKMVPIKNGTEYGLPQTLVQMSKDYPVKVIESSWWLQITNMDDIKRVPNLVKTKFKAG